MGSTAGLQKFSGGSSDSLITTPVPSRLTSMCFPPGATYTFPLAIFSPPSASTQGRPEDCAICVARILVNVAGICCVISIGKSKAWSSSLKNDSRACGPPVELPRARTSGVNLPMFLSRIVLAAATGCAAAVLLVGAVLAAGLRAPDARRRRRFAAPPSASTFSVRSRRNSSPPWISFEEVGLAI